jgi:hypothetical protein
VTWFCGTPRGNKVYHIFDMMLVRKHSRFSPEPIRSMNKT